MAAFEKVNYHLLHKGDRPTYSRGWQITAITLLGLLTVSTLLNNLWLFQLKWPQDYTTVAASNKDVNCGNTPDAAREAGCIFDINTWIWQPAACFDRELYEDETSKVQTEYFEHYNGNISVPYADVLAGKYEELYTTNSYHVNHCTYAWKKLHRAVLHGQLVDSEIANLKHSIHCSMILRTPGKLDQVSTGTRMSYATCVRI